MPAYALNPPFGGLAPDGRAAEIVRGVQRMLAEEGWASLTEVTLASGRRADVMAVSPKGDILIIEVKSCLQDFMSDAKWPEYPPWCDRFLFAVDCDFPQQRLPPESGLIVADSFGGAIIRPHQEQEKLSGARRKSITLSFARLAAFRLARAAEVLQADGLTVGDAPEPAIE